MKVFVVLWHWFEDTELIAVCTKKEIAEALKAQHNGKPDRATIYVEEIETDVLPYDKRQYIHWRWKDEQGGSTTET